MSFKFRLKLWFQKIMRKPLDFFRRVCIFFGFPHVWTCFFILLIAAAAFAVSYRLNEAGNSYWSSMFANLFAGLTTGFVICLIGSIKQISVIKMKEKRAWLDRLAKQILEYRNYHHKLLQLHFDHFDGDEKIFEMIYDTGARASWINEEILQSSFSQTLSFNTVRYCKKYFEYDAVKLSSEYENLHEMLTMVDVVCPDSKTIIKYFEPVDHVLWKLHSNVRKAADDLDIRLSEIQKSFI